jgi:hypothetical protein
MIVLHVTKLFLTQAILHPATEGQNLDTSGRTSNIMQRGISICNGALSFPSSSFDAFL